MKKELLELVRERLIKVEDTKQQIDILQYFIDIEFFMDKVSEYKWLSSRVPEKYHDLSIRDFVVLSAEQLEKVNSSSKSFPDIICGWIALKEFYSIKEYKWKLENGCKVIDGALGCSNTEDRKNRCGIFVEHILKNMDKDDQLFDVGIALFHDDGQVQELAKQYRMKNN